MHCVMNSISKPKVLLSVFCMVLFGGARLANAQTFDVVGPGVNDIPTGSSVTSTINLGASGAQVNDVSVQLFMTDLFASEVSFSLSHLGTTVVLGSGGNNKIFASIAGFNGSLLDGDWVLSMTDTFIFDGTDLFSWRLFGTSTNGQLSALTTGLPMANAQGPMLINASQTVTGDINNHLFSLMAGDGEEAANAGLASAMDDGVIVGQGDGPEDPIARKGLRSRQCEVFTTVNYGNVKLSAVGTSTPHGTLQLVRELAASFHQPPWSTRAVRNWLTSVRLPKSSRRVSGLLRRSIAAIYFSSFHPCVPAPKVPSGFVLTK